MEREGWDIAKVFGGIERGMWLKGVVGERGFRGSWGESWKEWGIYGLLFCNLWN